MSLNITKNFNWQTRSASYSTHGSRKGTNLLGWGNNEEITSEIRKKSIIARENQIIKQITKLPKTNKKRIELVKELNELKKSRGITFKKGKITKKERGESIRMHLLDVIREEVPKARWAIWMNEAVRRYNSELEKGENHGITE